MDHEASILVVGRSGRLARALVEEAGRLGVALRALGRPQLDIENSDSVRRVLEMEAPSAIVNAAGCVEVDEAEVHPDHAFALNRDGVARLAEAAARRGSVCARFQRLRVRRPCDDARVEDDLPAPLNIYGRSKIAGEEAALAAYPSAAVRPAGPQPFGRSFLTTMLRLAEAQDVVRVVADQHGTPTSGAEFARALLDITLQLRSRRVTQGGVYHLASSGTTTRLGFAQAIFAGWARRGYRVPRLEPITRADWDYVALVVCCSPLDCGKAERIFDWLAPW